VASSSGFPITAATITQPWGAQVKIMFGDINGILKKTEAACVSK
jgi:hypothetical protein